MNDIYVTVYGVKQENGIKIKNPNHCFNWLISLDTKLYCRLIYIKLFLAANGIFPLLVKLKKILFRGK